MSELSLSVEEIRRLPVLERRQYVEKIRVYYPRWHEVTSRIQDLYDMQPYAAEPPCLMLVGRTGAGKSTIAKHFVQKYPPFWTASGKCVPVLRSAIIPPATVIGMAENVLNSLGDPAAHKGTGINKTKRLTRLFNDCGVRLWILDEIQHFVDRDSEKVLKTVSDWLKTFLKEETKVACLLVGLQREAEQVLQANAQLQRLFGTPISVDPFIWDERLPKETITPFRALLREIETQLPLNDASNLWHSETAQRCFAACNGTLGHIMVLIRGATHLALRDGREKLDYTLLATAYESFVDYPGKPAGNPFRGALPSVTLSTVPQQGSNGMTNRRSKASTKNETLRDMGF